MPSHCSFSPTTHSPIFSDRLKEVLSQLSQAMISAIHTSHPGCNLLHYTLCDLARMENHPQYLTEMAYEWCSVICEAYQSLTGVQNLLFLSLEVGFRHLDSKKLLSFPNTKFHHCKLIDITFESGDSEVIADLLLALCSIDGSCGLCRSPNMWVKYLEHLHNLQPFSSRLRKHLILFIGSVGYKEFKGVGPQALVVLLEDLHVGVGDVDEDYKLFWISFLLDTVQSPEATQHLPHHTWELLVELSILKSRWSQRPPQFILSAQVMVSLEDAQEWDKLECWIGVVWINWPPEDIETTGDSGTAEDSETAKDGGVTGRGLKDVMLSLFHQCPGVIQRLQRLMGKCEAKGDGFIVPELFEQICKQMHLKAEQQGTR